MAIFYPATYARPFVGATGSPPPPPPQTGSGGFFDTGTWLIGPNVGGTGGTTGLLKITPPTGSGPTSGSLLTNEHTPDGNDNSFGFASALRGVFPFAPNTGSPQGSYLPNGITSIDVTVHFYTGSILPGHSRYHLFIALYYKLDQAVSAGPTYQWVDTQYRIVQVDGVNQPSGHTETYDPGDSFGWALVPAELNPNPTGSTYHFSRDIEQQFQSAVQAWGISTSIGHQLLGIEIGVEGFVFDEVDAIWSDLSLTVPGGKVARQKTYAIDVDLKGSRTRTGTINILPKKNNNTKTSTTDIRLAVGVGSPTKTSLVDIDLFKTQTKTNTTNILIKAPSVTRTSTIDIDALRRSTKTHRTDIDIKGTIKKTHSIDMQIGTGGGGGGGGLLFDHIVVIVLENQSINEVYGPPPSPPAPYLTNLANTYAFAEHYSGIDHPSEPNYLAMGFGLAGDCGNPVPNIGGCMTGGDDSIADHNSTAPNNPTNMGNGPSLIDRMEAAGLTWSAYLEGYNGTNNFNSSYHAWMLFQNNIVNNPTRKANIKAYSTTSPTALITELNSATPHNVIWVNPDNSHNMHDNGVASGDTFMSGLIPQILNSNTFLTKRAVLFVVFDEGNDTIGPPTAGLDLVYTCLAGPLVKPGYKSGDYTASPPTGTPYTHYSFLHTVLVNWGLASLQSTDAGATTMSEFFIGH